MADVYGSASLNIAATASTTSSTGLFIADPKRISKPLVFDVDLRTEDYHIKGGCSLVSDDLWTARVDHTPLNKRAWVLQERILSSRILHFDSDQLFWECQELQACEWFPFGLPAEIKSRELKGYRAIMTLDQPDSAIREVWRLIVERYSRLALTFRSDKLVAIRGISQRFETLLEDVCIAGLWQKTLVTDLLWWRAGDVWTDNQRPQDSVAPSWSWACLDAPVYYSVAPIEHREKLTIVATINPVQVNSDSGPPWQLDVQAPLLKAGWTFLEIYKGTRVQTLQLRTRQLVVRLMLDARPGDFEGTYTSSKHQGVNAEADYPHSKAANPNGEPRGIWVYLMFVASESPASGLLLKRTPASGQYSRIGVFDTSIWPAGTPVMHDPEPLSDFREDSHDISPEDYNTAHGDGVYSFIIV
jgi:hypothetical protein